MGQVIDLMEALRKALGQVPAPLGVKAPPTVSIEKDSDDANVASGVYRVDDTRAKAEELLEFTREVEAAAADALPGLWVYVDFTPAGRKRSRGSA
jgi:hypothetical protein